MKPLVAPVLLESPLLQPVGNLFAQGLHGFIDPFGGYGSQGSIKVPHHPIQINPKNKTALVHDYIVA
jgi:hypothetical protein